MSSQQQQQKARHQQHEWGYSHETVGPSEWAKYYETGALQSPINILVNQCEHQQLQSTCCHGQLVVESAATKKNLPDRLRQALNIKPRAHQVHHHQRRAHLDSVGEEKQDEQHKRSASSSSNASKNSSTGSSGNKSGSSSPVRLNDDYEDDEYDEEDDAYDHGSGSYEDESGTSSPVYDHDDDDRARRRNNGKCASKAAHNNNNNSGSRRLTQQQNTRFCVSHKKIFLGYPRYLNTIQLCNTGHSWQVNLPTELANHTLLSGPPLGDREYRLAQLHCHWGEDCEHGSEHQINGKYYSAEIHFVHWNCTDFKSMEEAARHKHGLAVLGVMVQALDGEQNQNKHLEKIIAGLKRVHKPNSSVSIHAKLDLKKLFPSNRWNYASYEGSLTTPPLSEVVDWIVFLNPITCSTSQIEEFRKIRCPSAVNNSGNNLLNNCRPVQPSNDRLVSIWSHH